MRVYAEAQSEKTRHGQQYSAMDHRQVHCWVDGVVTRWLDKRKRVWQSSFFSLLYFVGEEAKTGDELEAMSAKRQFSRRHADAKSLGSTWPLSGCQPLPHDPRSDPRHPSGLVSSMSLSRTGTSLGMPSRHMIDQPSILLKSERDLTDEPGHSGQRVPLHTGP